MKVALIENIQHKTMNPIEEAVAFNQYVESFGWDGISELARRIGKSQEFVTKGIKLLRLPERVREENYSPANDTKCCIRNAPPRKRGNGRVR